MIKIINPHTFADYEIDNFPAFPTFWLDFSARWDLLPTQAGGIFICWWELGLPGGTSNASPNYELGPSVGLHFKLLIYNFCLTCTFHVVYFDIDRHQSSADTGCFIIFHL